MFTKGNKVVIDYFFAGDMRARSAEEITEPKLKKVVNKIEKTIREWQA